MGTEKIKLNGYDSITLEGKVPVPYWVSVKAEEDPKPEVIETTVVETTVQKPEETTEETVKKPRRRKTKKDTPKTEEE
jgi:hypothetical protein